MKKTGVRRLATTPPPNSLELLALHVDAVADVLLRNFGRKSPLGHFRFRLRRIEGEQFPEVDLCVNQEPILRLLIFKIQRQRCSRLERFSK
jgi:hypothetical protein